MIEQQRKRPIRSFVKREGRISKRQAMALSKYWPKYGLSVAMSPLDFTDIFGRQVELILEIGFGMGHSLLEMAQKYPEKNFIGVEVHKPGVGALLADIEEQQVSNIRVFNEDVTAVLQQCIPDNSLAGVQIFFPDPWPKKRHHKRRLIQAQFVELLCQKLKLGGTLHLATDWQHYAEEMLAVASAQRQLKNISGEGKFHVSNNGLRPVTKFEQRGKRLGHQIFDLLFVKNNE